MANLKNHGSLIGKIEYLTYTTAYMSDRHILKNYGQGWKLYRKVKAELNPRDIYLKNLAKVTERESLYPLSKEYKHKLIKYSGLQRSIVHAAIESMSDDPDGIYSAFDYDYKINLTIEECTELCKLYQLAIAQEKE